MTSAEIISYLPYDEPFLFVDEITMVSQDEIGGHYTFQEDAFFYQGHFRNNPITPGVILTETMAQIGLVCFGIYLLKNEIDKTNLPKIALTSHEMDFFLPVFPGEKVTVISKKVYFRFQKLKCHVELFNANNQLVCRGNIAGMITSQKS